MVEAALLSRFWSKVEVCDKDKCWLWSGAKTSANYGIISLGGKHVAAHRLSWCIHNNTELSQLTREDYITHDCDNPPCVNPNHLKRGGGVSNNLETTLRNRRARGEATNSAKLTASDVLAIRRMAKTWDGMCDAMKKYKISQTHVMNIANRKMWKHLK